MGTLVKIMLALALTLFAAGTALAAKSKSGIDRSFGKKGSVETAFSEETDTTVVSAKAHSVSIQPDRRILVAGSETIYDAWSEDALSSALVATRYLPDGALDPSFSGDGKLRIEEGLSGALGSVVQASGRIVVADYGEKLVGLHPDGSLDPSFGDGGIAALPSLPWMTDLGMQRDGSLVVAGDSSEESKIFGLTPDGRLDPAFGDSGVAQVELGSERVFLDDMAVDASGRIVVIGELSRKRCALARLTAKGELDRRFSGDGIAYARKQGALMYECPKLAMQSRGRIILAKNTAGSKGKEMDAGLVRLKANGRRDRDFGRRGLASADFGGTWDEVGAVAVDSKNRPLVSVAAAGIGSGEASVFGTARFSPRGTLDRSFGKGGTSSGRSAGTDFPLDIAIQGNHKPVVVGEHEPASSDYAGGPSWSTFKTVRYLDRN